MRNRPEPEDIFLNSVKSMIENLLINNPNYKSDYYFNGGEDTLDTLKLMNDTQDRARYILKKIKEWDHLVKPFEEKIKDLPHVPKGEIYNEEEEKKIKEIVGELERKIESDAKFCDLNDCPSTPYMDGVCFLATQTIKFINNLK